MPRARYTRIQVETADGSTTYIPRSQMTFAGERSDKASPVQCVWLYWTGKLSPNQSFMLFLIND